jgi:hypothetical protein
VSECGSGGKRQRLEHAAERSAQFMWRVACDRIQAKRQSGARIAASLTMPVVTLSPEA